MDRDLGCNLVAIAKVKEHSAAVFLSDSTLGWSSISLSVSVLLLLLTGTDTLYAQLIILPSDRNRYFIR